MRKAQDEEFNVLLDRIAIEPEEFEENDIDNLANGQYAVTMNGATLKMLDDDLWALLCGKLSGKAMDALQTLGETRWHGIIAWQRLFLEAKGDQHARAVALLRKLEKPKRSTLGDLQHDLHVWDRDVADLNRLQRDSMSELSQLTSLLNMLPEEMESRVQELPGHNTLKEVRKYVNDQLHKVRQRPEMFNSKPKKAETSTKANGGIVPMDVSQLSKEELINQLNNMQRQQQGQQK